MGRPDQTLSISPITTTAEAKDKDSQEPAFICTICWQGQPYGSRPKLLGTSARIVCDACWSAVLDLSICWVCGECIVRGDEVVSLGWCFWHRSCFGCLVCKTKMSVPATGDEGIGEWDGSEDESPRPKRRRRAGVELQEIPLCGVCRIETAGDNGEDVVEKGLETVSMNDGGLSRDRLNMLVEKDQQGGGAITIAPRHMIMIPRKLRGAREIERDLKHYINRRSSGFVTELSHDEADSPLIDNIAEMEAVPGDGVIESEEHSHSDDEMAEFGQPNSPPSITKQEVSQDVYVSLFDPIGDPAFKASKTKPLPKWMHLLPNNVYRERERDREIPTKSSEFVRSSHEVPTLTPNTPPPEEISENQPADTPRMSPSPYSTCPATPMIAAEQSVLSPSMPAISLGKSSKIKFTCPYGQLVADEADKSQDAELSPSISEPEFLPPRQLTPFPRIDSAALERSVTPSYFNHAMSMQPPTDGADPNTPWSQTDTSLTPPSSAEKTPELSQIFVPRPRTGRATKPTAIVYQSSEYLERYQPLVAEPVAFSKYVPKDPSPILDKIRRQRGGRRSSEEKWDERTAEDRSRSSSLSSAMDIEGKGAPKRSDLHKELMDLFCND